MVMATYNGARGWHDPTLLSHQDLSISPAAMVFHYGQAIFEGLKAYRLVNRELALFRPTDNADRFRRSAIRMSMPPVSVDLFIDSCVELVRADHEWVPNSPGQSLYLRPFMIASEAQLGVRAAREYLFIVIASPVDPFFSAEPEPIKTWITTDYTRAAPGGTGTVKCAGNYAASLLAQSEATAAGCDQVVWLDSVERRWVEELGGMNLYFVKSPRGQQPILLTPRLTDTILNGITRDSVATIASELGYRVEDGAIDINEVLVCCETGEITEAFACGTAAVVAPIGELHRVDGTWVLGDGRPGKVTMAIREALLNIQHGVTPDTHGWNMKIGDWIFPVADRPAGYRRDKPLRTAGPDYDGHLTE
jgi:branched-chain amino acid aminotransferase